jgi:hypothetical protein
MIPYILLILYMSYQPFIQSSLDSNAEAYYSKRKNKITQKIYDIAHYYLPNLEEYYNLSDIVTFLCIVPLVFYNMIPEYISFFIPLFITRSIVNRMTVLPKQKKCAIEKTSITSGGCYDKIYSGHFSSALLATLLYYKYNLINLNVLVLINIVNGIMILLTRGHYTIDIYVACISTLLFYQNNIKVSI